MYRLLTVHIVGSFTYSGLCFSVFCVLEVLCLILVRGLLEVFGGFLPPPLYCYFIRTGVYTLTESADMERAQNTFQDAEHFSRLVHQSF